MKKYSFFVLCTMLLITATTMNSCKKNKNSNNATDPNDPDAVAKTNLVAMYHFDGNGNDASGNGYNGTANNVSFTTGKVGQALQCTDNGWVGVPLTAGNKIWAMQEYTIAFWVYLPQPTETNNNLRYNLLQLVDQTKTDMWGNINIQFDNDWKSLAPDSAMLKVRQQNDVTAKDATGWGDQSIGFEKMYYGAGFGKWVHLAFTYDAATSHPALYVNGINVQYSERWQKLWTKGWNDEQTSTDFSNIPRGTITWTQPGDLIIGNWAAITGTPANVFEGNSWMAKFTGMIDELRIYNRALTADEMGTVYIGELAKANP